MYPFEIITTIIQTASLVAFVVYVFLTYRLWKATLAGNQPELQILGRVRYDYTGQISDKLINNLLEVENNG